MKTIWVLLFCSILLIGCSKANDKTQIPSQHWNGVDVHIETHPDPPLTGMSEIVVVVTKNRTPVHDLRVSLRANDAALWIQAIQDGSIGVYRRVVDLGSKDNTVLQVRLQRPNEETILFFPVKLIAG